MLANAMEGIKLIRSWVHVGRGARGAAFVRARFGLPSTGMAVFTTECSITYSSTSAGLRAASSIFCNCKSAGAAHVVAPEGTNSNDACEK